MSVLLCYGCKVTSTALQKKIAEKISKWDFVGLLMKLHNFNLTQTLNTIIHVFWGTE